MNKLLLVLFKRLQLVPQDLDKVAGHVAGLDVAEAGPGQRLAVLGHRQKMVTSLSHVRQELFRVLLIASSVIRDEQTTARFQPPL